ncbi:metal ABC transporter permease [Fructilactobacillus fructivorans]|uniref:metal ABC transporter permease n=1 Tax=Fructilactobacillus fructivorans TaxID=1614 RepID=UPI000704B289|nr:metal ABC transporter permease [Fructilactobacillus fructivorans]KRN42973.1 ABC-type Mn2+ Zn2+ transport system, permease component [Fructilactobacillus fructivorans]
MFSFEFMRNAFLASTIIAVVCGVIGVFVVSRNMPFLTHTLSEIGFAGASFGMFIGISPLNGMLLFTTISSVLIGKMSSGSVAERREDTISAVSALFIGLGVLFLALSNSSASYATNILFGSIVGISASEVHQMIWLSVIVLIVTLFIYRDLKFDSFDAVGARAQKIPSGILSLIFLVMLALSVSVAAQIVGALLIFILLTLPAASAKYFVHSVSKMIGLAIVFGLVGVWVGLTLGYYTNWPVSFFIAVIEVVIYFSSLIYNHFVEG